MFTLKIERLKFVFSVLKFFFVVVLAYFPFV